MPKRHRRRPGTLPALAGLLAFAALPASVATASEDEQNTVPLRVATYNIHAGIGEDGAFDPDRTAATLSELDADVIGLQEVDVHWSRRSQWRDLARELARDLGMHLYFAPIYSLDPREPGQPRREHGPAVLSRYPVLDAENHMLTRLPMVGPSDGPVPMPGFPEVELLVKGVTVHLYVTHMDHRRDPSLREREVAETVEIMADDCGPQRCPPQVLVGDFNAPPGAPELGELWGRVTDAAPPAPGYTFPADEPVKRIDYVTVAGGIRPAGAAEVVETQASDHLPVVADLLLPR